MSSSPFPGSTSSRIAFTWAADGLGPSSSMQCPRISAARTPNWHFENFNRAPASSSRRRTDSSDVRWSSADSVPRLISSIKAHTSLPLRSPSMEKDAPTLLDKD
ncbi:unnamed protein product [Chondrus crispus]|uniref:Uncharacterized protein n=1 Tax=Chondrus crispus TaxID=2769 RepID=R7Q8F3_CHOCR|nr:unnamed protein product [Chondrus crispus]CDF34068.1 unnamed protein product [Chondrus crispus]|eukprot:XP_005713887.1 unnamed protein product [Chondrus crispus]